MAINTSLLIAADVLQDLLVDKLGEPLVNGIVTCYQNNARTVLKNWYYQSSANASSTTPTFNTLPNPLVLSAAGTIVDVNGNDVIPYFYPYNENDNETIQRYYITVYDQFGTLQFTRSYFPYNVTDVQVPTATTVSENNLIINNRFWRNNYTSSPLSLTAQSVTPPALPTWADGAWTYQYNESVLTSMPYYYATLAPSQHDGFSMPDFVFLTQNTSSTESLQFVQFTQSADAILTDDVTPQYYLQYGCNSSGTGGMKALQFPLSYQLLSIGPTAATFSIQSILNAVGAAAEFTVNLYQFLGSDETSPDPVTIGTFVPTITWEKTIITFEIPGTENLSISTATADSAYYIQIVPPLNSTFNVSLALPSLFLSTGVPVNDFSTYDQIDAIINTPRTGDLRTSINSYYPFGWVPMNDGTIGYSTNSDTYITTRNNTDTWPLYNLLWNTFYQYSTAAGTAGTNPLVPMYNTSGVSIGYGVGESPSTAVSDYKAGNALSLTKSMGKVLLGTVPIESLLVATDTIVGYQSTVSVANSSGYLELTTANAINAFNGMPFIVSNTGGALPTGLAINTVYYVAVQSGNAFLVSPSFEQAIAANDGTLASNCIAYTNAGTGVTTVYAEPLGATTGEYDHTQLVGELASHAHAAASPTSTFFGNATTQATQGGTGTNFGQAATTAPTGSSTAFNVTQPSTFTNVFIKL